MNASIGTNIDSIDIIWIDIDSWISNMQDYYRLMRSSRKIRHEKPGIDMGSEERRYDASFLLCKWSPYVIGMGTRVLWYPVIIVLWYSSTKVGLKLWIRIIRYPGIKKTVISISIPSVLFLRLMIPYWWWGTRAAWSWKFQVLQWSNFRHPCRAEEKILRIYWRIFTTEYSLDV